MSATPFEALAEMRGGCMCPLPPQVLYYEGIVVENYYNGNYLVDFGQEESTETINIKNMQKVGVEEGGEGQVWMDWDDEGVPEKARADVRLVLCVVWQVMSWNELELKDHVQVGATGGVISNSEISAWAVVVDGRWRW